VFDRFVERLTNDEAARTTWEPHTDPDVVPSTVAIKGTSAFRKVRDPVTGEEFYQWVKTERKTQDRINEIVRVFRSIPDLIPVVPRIPGPKHTVDDLMCVIAWGDPHFGMLAWGVECGEDFDLKIAEREHMAACQGLIDKSPPAAVCVIINLGDMHHANDSKAVTPKSGHALDVDSRYPKVLKTTIRVAIACIEYALRKFGAVEFRPNKGNHDPEAAVALGLAVEQRYHDNPRVTVHVPYQDYWHKLFGRVLIASAHGDHCKPAELVDHVVTAWREDWGHAWHAHGYLGHRHQSGIVERAEMTIETFRTIAPKDAYAAGHAKFRSGRDMRAHVWHATEGLIEQHVMGIRKIKELAG
jgi:hypothetical protein